MSDRYTSFDFLVAAFFIKFQENGKVNICNNSYTTFCCLGE